MVKSGAAEVGGQSGWREVIVMAMETRNEKCRDRTWAEPSTDLICGGDGLLSSCPSEVQLSSDSSRICQLAETFSLFGGKKISNLAKFGRRDCSVLFLEKKFCSFGRFRIPMVPEANCRRVCLSCQKRAGLISYVN